MVKLVCLLQLHFKQTLLVQAFSGGFTDKLPDSSHHGPLTTETQKGLQWLLAEALCNALEDPFSFSKIFFFVWFSNTLIFRCFSGRKSADQKNTPKCISFFCVCLLLLCSRLFPPWVQWLKLFTIGSPPIHLSSHDIS